MDNTVALFNSEYLTELYMATSPNSPGWPNAAGGPSTVGSSTYPTLNPQATPFFPSPPSGTTAEELPEWLLFSPSSSEGRSGRPSSVSPTTSFTDVVHQSGSTAPQWAGSSVGHRLYPNAARSVTAEFSQVACHDGKTPIEESSPKAAHERWVHGGCSSGRPSAQSCPAGRCQASHSPPPPRMVGRLFPAARASAGVVATLLRRHCHAARSRPI
jgi:hypothetical protein